MISSQRLGLYCFRLRRPAIGSTLPSGGRSRIGQGAASDEGRKTYDRYEYFGVRTDISERTLGHGAGRGRQLQVNRLD